MVEGKRRESEEKGVESFRKWEAKTISTFHTTDLFLYPLKTSENQRFSQVFMGYRKRSVTRNGLTKWKYVEDRALTLSSIML